MLMATRKFKIEPRTEEAVFLYSSPKMTANPMGLYFEKRTSPISVTPSPGRSHAIHFAQCMLQKYEQINQRGMFCLFFTKLPDHIYFNGNCLKKNRSKTICEAVSCIRKLMPIGVPKTEKAFMHKGMGQHALTNRTEQSL